ncbi:hypothetical protein [Caminibacter sp.]
MYKFLINKIKGDFAENICKIHFESMGCRVSKTGVEELSIDFAKMKDYKRLQTKNLKNLLQIMPDFLVTNTVKNDAALVEVKFLKNINNKILENFSEKLHKRYEYLISQNLPIYFYLVTNKKPYVYIMKANSKKGRPGGFYCANDKTLDNFYFFNAERKFTEIYENIVEIALSDIFE